MKVVGEQPSSRPLEQSSLGRLVTAQAAFRILEASENCSKAQPGQKEFLPFPVAGHTIHVTEHALSHERACHPRPSATANVRDLPTLPPVGRELTRVGALIR